MTIAEPVKTSTVGAVLKHVQPAPAYRILMRFPEDRRHRIVQFAGDHVGDQAGAVFAQEENFVVGALRSAG